MVFDTWANLHNLESLTLDGTSITDGGLVHLSGLSRLKELNLTQTDISGSGLQHLAGLRQLEELRLDGTNVSDDGLVHLKGLEKLLLLRLDNTEVSDAGLEDIESILRSKWCRLGDNADNSVWHWLANARRSILVFCLFDYRLLAFLVFLVLLVTVRILRWIPCAKRALQRECPASANCPD